MSAGKGNIDDLFNLRAAFPRDEEKEAFFSAIERNDIRSLQKTLKKWPDAAAKWCDKYNNPPLISAYREIKPETIAFLVKNGASLDQTTAGGDYTPLIYSAFLGSVKEVEKFLRAGADVNARDKVGRLALHMAVEHNPKPEIVDLLVVCGADPMARSNWNKTAYEECKSDDLRDVMKAAEARREAFLQSLKDKPEAAAPDSDEIKLLKRIELRKGGVEPPPEKKSWWQRNFG